MFFSFFLFSAQTNVRTLGLPLRAPVPTTSPTYAPAFPPSFLPSSATSPFLYPSYNYSAPPYWCSPYFTNSAAAGAPPAANGGPHHPEGPPAIAGSLYPIAVGVGTPHHRLSEVPSSGDSRGSAEYCNRDDGSDKEGGSGQGVSRGQSPIRSQKVHHRFHHPYESRASSSSSSKKRDFEETVSICEGEKSFIRLFKNYNVS